MPRLLDREGLLKPVGKNASAGFTANVCEELLAAELPRALADPILRQFEASFFVIVTCQATFGVKVMAPPVGKTRIGVDVMYAKQTLYHIKNIIFTVFILYIAVIALSFMRTAMSGTHCTSPQLDGFKPQVEYQWVSPPRVLRESHFCLSAG